MKMRTIRRGVAVLCLMCVLAACARESAPAREPQTGASPAAARLAAPPPSAPDRSENSGEYLRLISNCLEQNKSRLPLYEILSLERETFFADYGGGETEVLAAEPDGQRQNSPLRTDSAWFWRDGGGEASPQQAAQALVGLMLTHYQSLPESGRKLTVEDFSVAGQEPYAWEDLPMTVLCSSPFADIAGNQGCEAALAAIKSRLADETQDGAAPFGYIDLVFALGEDTWALKPVCQVKYEGAEELREEQGEAFILMRDGDVWRMQRAAALAEQFADEPFIRRMGGYTLSQLEHSMIEGGREYYIEQAPTEYLRRLALDPEAMYEHMDTLGLPRLTHLCRKLAWASDEGFEPEGESYSAGLIREFIELEKNRDGGSVIPPATGQLCPAILFDGMKAGVGPRLAFVSDELLVFYGYFGVFAYDFVKEELVFSADLLTAMGWTGIETGDCVRPIVDADGSRIRLAYTQEGWDHYLIRYEIDTVDWSWEFVEYELPPDDTGEVFSLERDGFDYGSFACKPENGWVSDLLSDLVYERGGRTVRIFDGVPFGPEGPSKPLPPD